MSWHKIGAAMAAFFLVATGFSAVAVAQAAAGEPVPWQLGLQDPATPVRMQLTDFHDLLLVIITAISVLVLALLVYVIVRFNAGRNPSPSRTSHNTLLEVAWTVVPVIILIIIAVPSFRILYYMDRTAEPDMTIKVTDHQWYWEYEYPDHEGVSFAAYMIPDDQLHEGQRRLLETDEVVVLSTDRNIRILVTAGDVLHSWAMPSWGVKTDAIPGRLNETWARIEEPGVYYDRWSEICGTGHVFMPIMVRAVPPEEFDAWIGRRIAEMKGEPAATQVVGATR